MRVCAYIIVQTNRMTNIDIISYFRLCIKERYQTVSESHTHIRSHITNINVPYITHNENISSSIFRRVVTPAYCYTMKFLLAAVKAMIKLHAK